MRQLNTGGVALYNVCVSRLKIDHKPGGVNLSSPIVVDILAMENFHFDKRSKPCDLVVLRNSGKLSWDLSDIFHLTSRRLITRRDDHHHACLLQGGSV